VAGSATLSRLDWLVGIRSPAGTKFGSAGGGILFSIGGKDPHQPLWTGFGRTWIGTRGGTHKNQKPPSPCPSPSRLGEGERAGRDCLLVGKRPPPGTKLGSPPVMGILFSIGGQDPRQAALGSCRSKILEQEVTEATEIGGKCFRSPSVTPVVSCATRSRNIFRVVYMDVETRSRQVSPGVVEWMMARHPRSRRPQNRSAGGEDPFFNRRKGSPASRADFGPVARTRRRLGTGLGHWDGTRAGDFYFVPLLFRHTGRPTTSLVGKRSPAGTKFGSPPVMGILFQ